MQIEINGEKVYTLGEMAKLGLVKNRNYGGAIKDKSYLSKVLKGVTCIPIMTKHGPGKGLTQKQIDEYNAGLTPRWKPKKTKA